MHALYVLSVALHVLAAITWVGGIAFVTLVVVPWLRGDGAGVAAAFLRSTGQRFSRIAWFCFGILLVTGTFNLWIRGVRFELLVSPRFLASTGGRLIWAKLGLFAAIVVVSLVHDFVVGPAAVDAIKQDPDSPRSTGLRRRASMLGRLNALFALAIVLTAVMVVRGVPF